MPIYEGIGLVSEKHSVIIDIGRAYTKCGFARDTGPRVIIPTEVVHYESKKVVCIWNYRNEEELYFLLKDFLHLLYFKHLVVSPKDRRVVIVESVLCPIQFRSVLAKVLFKHFECPSILFAPAHLMALFTLGISSALVMDCGYGETLVLPIYEGVLMLNAWQAKPVGGEAIHRRIEAELMDKALVKSSTSEKMSLGAVLCVMGVWKSQHRAFITETFFKPGESVVKLSTDSAFTLNGPSRTHSYMEIDTVMSGEFQKERNGTEKQTNGKLAINAYASCGKP